MTNEAWNRRRTAARAYQPKRIRLLLVSEAPPADVDHYFYFAAPDSRDPLFDEVCGVLLEDSPAAGKEASLKELRRRGVFVVDLKPDAARAGESLAPYVTPFLLNLDALAPEKIILIGADVHDAAFGPMQKAGLPVVDLRIPSPTPEKEPEFRQKFRQAIVRGGLEKLIRPLKPGAKDAGE